MNTDACRRAWWAPLTAGAVLLALCAAGAALDRPGFYAAWLTAWWFWAGLALGAQATLWMQRLTGGGWIVPIAAPLDRLRAAVPALGLLVLPLLAAPGALYPWARPGWVDTAKETAFRHAWFSGTGMALRVAACIVVVVVLARIDGSRRATPRRAGFAAAGLLAYAFAISLLAVDLLMSLVPAWYSTAFGVLVLTAQLKAAMAAATAAGAPRAAAPVRGDLGNLLLMYVLTWAYIAFTQFQIIWAENLPAEISWYLPRLHGPWAAGAVALIVLGLAVPLSLLLSRAFKRSRTGLRGLAVLLLAVSLGETAWWVFPSVDGVGGHAAWMLCLAVAGMGLVARATALLLPTALPPAQAEAPRPEQREGESEHA